jgi:hypothetical protein
MAWKRMRNPGQVVFIGSAPKPVISFYDRSAHSVAISATER